MTMACENEADHAECSDVPVLVVRHGRGRTGGTTFLNWLIERAKRGGRPVLIGDGDRRNATLAGLYPPGVVGGASQPPSDQTADVMDWIRSMVGEMVKKRCSLFLDMGAGDQAMAEVKREIDLIAFCASEGVQPLFIGTMGPDMEDFEHLVTIVKSKVFETPYTILVMNENLVRAGKTTVGAFDGILNSPEMKELSRECKFIFMKRFVYMDKTRQAGLGFYDAAEGKPGKDGRTIPDPLWRFATRTWVENLESECRSEGIVGWLP